MNRRVRHPSASWPGLVCATLLTSFACGSDAPLPPSTVGASAASEPVSGETPDTPLRQYVGELYGSIIDATQAYAAFMCECEINGTTETIEECVWRTSPPIAPPIAECTQDVLGSDETSLPALECTAAARVAYIACLKESTCLDFEHQLDCQITYMQAADCPTIPWELWARNEVECVGNPPQAAHVCDDGTTIGENWVCDGEVDCPDASDEHGCSG